MSKPKTEQEKKTDFLKLAHELRTQKSTLEAALNKNREVAVTKGLTALSPNEITRVEQQLQLAYAALGKYSRRLASGDDLCLEEERMMLAHQDSIRKLETTLAALKSKADLTKKTDVDLAVELVRGGMDREQVMALYEGNREVEEALNAVD